MKNKASLYLFFFLFFFLSLFSSGTIDSQDGYTYLGVARNIYYEGEPTAPTGEYDTRKNIPLSVYEGPNGKSYARTGLGFSIAYLPAVFLTDVFYRIYDITPSIRFPLESDWLINFFASFTNAFFASLLGVFIYKYLRILGLKTKISVIIVFIGIISTNLFVLSKHSFPHMMFLTFIFGSFYFLKSYSAKMKRKDIILSGIFWGVSAITYNQTFILALPVYIIYYLFLFKPNILTKKGMASVLTDVAYFLLSTISFIMLYFWFEGVRGLNFDNPSTFTSYASQSLFNIPIPLFFEAIWSQLFGPGRSLFLYSPILLVPFIYWSKLNKKIYPEVLNALLITIIFVLFMSAQYLPSNSLDTLVPYWHGEYSWGPRYLSIIIPFGLIVTGFVINKLSKKAKLIVILPLVVVGLYIQTLGVLMPYQIKFHDLENRFVVNNYEFPSIVYSNIIPRFSPIIMMSKKLIKLSSNFANTINNGEYNVRFYDGIDFPIDIGPERWRTLEDNAYISFDNTSRVSTLTLNIINHPTNETKSDAVLTFYLNEEKIKEETISVEERKQIDLKLDEATLLDKDNVLLIETQLIDEKVVNGSDQIVGLLSVYINDELINKESIDVPYVSQLGPAMTNSKYTYWGGKETDPWKYWHIHTQVFERTPDLWWVRPIYYWDFPKRFFNLLFVVNLAGLTFFGYKLVKKVDTS